MRPYASLRTTNIMATALGKEKASERERQSERFRERNSESVGSMNANQKSIGEKRYRETKEHARKTYLSDTRWRGTTRLKSRCLLTAATDSLDSDASRMQGRNKVLGIHASTANR